MSHRHVLIVLIVAGVAAASIGALAGVLPSSDEDLSVAPRAVKLPKLSSQLAAVVEAERASGRGLAIARESGLYVARGKIRVMVEIRESREEVARVLLAAGGEIEAMNEGLIQALVAPGELIALTRQPEVVYVRAPRRPFSG